MPIKRLYNGVLRLCDEAKKLMIRSKDKFSVFSVFGGKPWSELQKGSSTRLILNFSEELGLLQEMVL